MTAVDGVIACPLCGRPFPADGGLSAHLLGDDHSKAELVTGLVATAGVIAALIAPQPCDFKPFPTEHAAMTHALAEVAKVRRPYFHRRCGRWHLGRSKATERTSP